MKNQTTVRLSTEIVAEAAIWLAERDEAIDRVVQKHGPPPLWAREPSFKTLVHLILEQQVSLASANACFQKLLAIFEERPFEPTVFLTFSDEKLRETGFSRQKTEYARHLASALIFQKIDLSALEKLPDEAVKTELKKLKGIGDWTADIFLSECLLRPDILPKGDIAMLEAIKVLKNLPARPDHDHFLAITAHWRPWRSVGTRLLWHFYLKEIRTAATGTGSFLPEK